MRTRPDQFIIRCSCYLHLDRVFIQPLDGDVGIREDRLDGGHGGVSLLAASVSVEAVFHPEGPVQVRLALGAASTAHCGGVRPFLFSIDAM